MLQTLLLIFGILWITNFVFWMMVFLLTVTDETYKKPMFRSKDEVKSFLSILILFPYPYFVMARKAYKNLPDK